MSLLKWYGSKHRLSEWLNQNMPPSEHTADLFFGSGSFSFGRLEAGLTKEITAMDLNKDVVNFWTVVKSVKGLGEFADLLTKEKYLYERNPKERFETVKHALNSGSLERVDRACKFYVLNKTAFNGLYRTNKQGQINTSWSKKTTFNIPTSAGLIKYAKLMGNINLLHGSYVEFFDHKHLQKPGVLVYLDPPYMGDSSSRVNYGVEEFNHTNMALNLRSTELLCFVSHVAQPEFTDFMDYVGSYSVVTTDLKHIASSTSNTRRVKQEALYRIN